MTSSSRCHVCGGEMDHVHEDAEIQIGNRTAVVGVSRSRCKDCGEIFYTPEEMDAAQMAAAEQLRKEDNLLGPADIRDIRAQYDLTQAQLEKLLGVGPKTVVRWERGTVFQSRSTDVLLRLIHDLPSVFEHLALRHGIERARCEQAKPQQVWRYVDHGSESKTKSRRVVVVPFVAREGSIQHKQMRLEREGTIQDTDIPVEVLR
jgi:HTH-type transcriptional regulator / antitoxin MqsA